METAPPAPSRRRDCESGDPDRRPGARRYRSAPRISTPSDDGYVAWNEPDWEGVLKHGVYHFHKKLGVDESVMWGEFFFLEAVDKALGGS